MTKMQIARLYDVSGDCMNEATKRLGLKYQHNKIGLARRGISAPTKDEILKVLQEEVATPQQYGERFGVTAGTVKRWVDKHKIDASLLDFNRRSGRIPGVLDEDALRFLYEESGYTIEDISKEYKTCGKRVTRLLREFGIKIKAPGFRGGPEFTLSNGLPVKSSFEVRVGNWLLENKVEFIYDPLIPGHRKWKSDFLANGYYIEIWGMTGWPPYDIQKQRKIDWYESRGLPLIQLTGKMVRKNAPYGRRLAKCLTHHPTAGPPRAIQLKMFD